MLYIEREKLERILVTLQDLVDLQNESPLDRDREAWRKVMQEARQILEEVAMLEKQAAQIWEAVLQAEKKQ